MKKITYIIVSILFSITLQGQEIGKKSKIEYAKKGTESLKNQEYQNAIQYFTLSLTSNYTKDNETVLIESNVYNFRGLAYMGVKDYQNAMKDYNLAIQNSISESDLQFIYNNRGFLKMTLQDYRGAILDFNYNIDKFNKSAAKNGRDITVDLAKYNSSVSASFSSKSFCNMKLNNFVEAIEDANVAIELNFNDELAYCVRGVCKFNLGQKESACLDFSKAGELGYEEAYMYIKKYCN
ncbi:hypothetical protein C3B47_14175 [Flavobacterium columnare]|uniref:tetratricopeptide repeat protein n=1 Tax=Flavobacterium TaxID=237 RepID=UPI001896A1DA|nr:hypothetical protein [Flavobacterium columnare]MBF6654001.1 hypothetical protein [Flavobacterium columnare]MBF6655059.1 hypothetical protein [Flavobacterium columnare]